MSNSIRIAITAAAMAAASACSDSTRPRPEPGRTLVPPASASGARAAAQSRKIAPIPTTPAAYHAANRQDWVGRSHNAMMDALRSDIRRNKPRDLCKTLERLARDAAAEAGARTGRANHEVARDADATLRTIGCGRGRAARQGDGDVQEASWDGASVTEGTDLSPEAWGMIAEIEGATAAASSAGELANSLAGISAAAQQLDPENAAVVDAMGSVALSSFEYWEQNGYAAAADLGGAYGECLERGGGDGCFFAARAAPLPRSGPTSQLVAFSRPVARNCGFGFMRVALADASGFTTGLTVGLKYARTPLLAVGSGLIGAIAASGGAFLYEAGRFWVCLYK